MNNQQKEHIEYLLSVRLRKSNRLEEKMEKAEADGDTEKYARLDRKDDMAIAEIGAICDVLSCLGYYAKPNEDDTKFIIYKRD